MKNIWVLGAPDPEMEAIERLLRAADQSVVYALASDGRRVHPGNAYAAVTPQHEAIWRNGRYTIVAVECAWAHRDGETGDVLTVDHHRPDDPGYGRPPAEFLPASSIGQAFRHLYCPRGGQYKFLNEDRWALIDTSWWGDSGPIVPDVTLVPADIVLVAAADHCLAAAYRGDCPGVDPDALMRWRAESRAAFQRRPMADVLADIERAIAALRTAPEIEIGGHAIADMRGRDTPELPEAAARIGVPFLAAINERGGRRKEVLQAAAPEVVAAWMAAHPGSYGDPARGFAGRYVG